MSTILQYKCMTHTTWYCMLLIYSSNQNSAFSQTDAWDTIMPAPLKCNKRQVSYKL